MEMTVCPHCKEVLTDVEPDDFCCPKCLEPYATTALPKRSAVRIGWWNWATLIVCVITVGFVLGRAALERDLSFRVAIAFTFVCLGGMLMISNFVVFCVAFLFTDLAGVIAAVCVMLVGAATYRKRTLGPTASTAFWGGIAGFAILLVGGLLFQEGAQNAIADLF